MFVTDDMSWTRHSGTKLKHKSLTDSDSAKFSSPTSQWENVTSSRRPAQVTDSFINKLGCCFLQPNFHYSIGGTHAYVSSLRFKDCPAGLDHEVCMVWSSMYICVNKECQAWKKKIHSVLYSNRRFPWWQGVCGYSLSMCYSQQCSLSLGLDARPLKATFWAVTQTLHTYVYSSLTQQQSESVFLSSSQDKILSTL